MEPLWYCLVALMVTAYVLLDGYDLGAGAIHLGVARGDQERRLVLRTIGPFWDGNEVWLIAGGGTLYFAFPLLYASGFSGFYLPLMVVLWLLILRGIAIEFRNHVESDVWRPFWDVVFSGASALLAVFFGAALGNIVRGVPLDGEGYFFLPLWTNFLPGHNAGILDWYTVLVAAAAFLALSIHGAFWVAHKTEGELEARCRALALKLWWGLAVLTAAITVASFAVQPHLFESFRARPWGYVFPIVALAGLVAMRFAGFYASTAYLSGMLASAAFSLYPLVLPSTADPARSLTVFNTAAPLYGLRIGLVWFVPGMLLAIGYSVYTRRKFAGKVALDQEGY